MTAVSQSSWFAVDVVVDAEAAEAIEAAFNVLDALGTEIDNLRKQPGDPVCVTGYFDQPKDENAVRPAIEGSLKIYGHASSSIRSISSRIVEETDWLAEWKKHWVPQKIAGFVIAPPWAEVDASDEIVIRIEPNMAFGTGTHETTQLCLSAIRELYTSDQSFLDVGTGTGILAIAAAKLGGRRILACDVDADSVKIAGENAAANEVAGHLQFFDGTITNQTRRHDLVCANLTLDVIIPLFPLMAEKTRRTLLLSGILAEQEETALRAVNAIFPDVRVDRAGEWIAIIARRGHPV